MHRIRTSFFAVAIVLLGGTLVAAQQPAQHPPAMPLLRQNAVGRMRLSIMAGRIVNATHWHFGNSTSTQTSGSSKEQLSLQGNGATGSLSYERTSPDEEFSLELNSDRRLRFRWSNKAEGPTAARQVEFVQTPGEPITLTIGPKDRPQVYRAATLWHLMIQQPEECRLHVMPVLDAMNSQWQFPRALAAVEADLLKMAGIRRTDRQQWDDWIQQLGDPKFTKREAADRQLRTVGPSLLGYLNRLDFDRLDAEQQFRVRRTIKFLSRQTSEDTPEQVAASLVEDPSVWLALLSRSDEPTRRTAAQQLTAILGGPIPVDPAADPASQQKARDELREQIEAKSGKKPAGKP